MRIMGPKYMTAGMGDAGACHPRDNIALRYLAQRLDLGYDLIYAVMYSRDKQSENMANKLVQLAREHGLPIVIHGKAYKPNVPYTDGSYSDLVGYYVQRQGYNVLYADPLTGHIVLDNTVAVVLLAHNASVTYQGTGVDIGESQFYYEFGKGSVIVDPWRTTQPIDGMKVIHYGNTRKS